MSKKNKSYRYWRVEVDGYRTIFFKEHIKKKKLYFLCRDPKSQAINYNTKQEWPYESDLYKFIMWNKGEKDYCSVSTENTHASCFTDVEAFEGEIFLDMI